MSYIYPELQNLLKLNTPPDSYQSMLRRYCSDDGVIIPTRLDEQYWAAIPTYTYARCPLCSVQLQSPIDTYSLAAWSSMWTVLKKSPFLLASEQGQDGPTCEHVVAVHTFINLHNQMLEGPQYFYNETGEVPLITPWCLQPDLRSYAVLHSLPICTIKDSLFTPSCTFFCLTYFSNAPAETIQRHNSSQRVRGGDTTRYFPAELSKPSPRKTYQLHYNLDYWANSGSLGFLDYSHPALPLVIGWGTQLPSLYQNIQGLKRGYTCRNGQKSFHAPSP